MGIRYPSREIIPISGATASGRATAWTTVVARARALKITLTEANFMMISWVVVALVDSESEGT